MENYIMNYIFWLFVCPSCHICLFSAFFQIFILYIWCISLHVLQISINCTFPLCILKTRQYINLKALEIWKHSFCKKNSHAFISWRIWDKYDVRELTVGLSTHRLYRKSKTRFSVYRPGGIQVIHIILKIRIRKKEGKKKGNT